MAITTNPVCTIDANTRVITVPAEYKELGVESDERATRINFRCPKIVGDGIDLSTLNLYINYENANKKLNSYLVDDVTVSGSNIEFSWLLSRHVTEASGTVRYIVCAKKSDDTEVINEWNTKVATGTVNAGLEATAEIEEQNADIIEQILKCIVELENSSGSSSGITLGLSSAAAGQIAKIKTVDTDGKPTKWETVDIPTSLKNPYSLKITVGDELTEYDGSAAKSVVISSSQGGDWSLINYIEIPDGAEETTALTINQDSDGQPFRLVKAKIFAGFPKYTGESTIPNHSFAMINGRTAGGSNVNPLGYTSCWSVPNATATRSTIWEVDCSGTIYKECTYKGVNWTDNTFNSNNVYDVPRYMLNNFDLLKPITSIGGTNMLLYPGCKIWLYGVRE